ncbi:hypothetical protein ONE63_000093 [Megalurothrips usitatus]|uniref:Uncharacterized protein n=1 Tax=Megalurothrips usitatus TaxID=439358 RepID=A0AAV7Y481_9NEOP|nr:hypothetical protein ONE63_000093 [Megalurothrips usitatus]
MWSQIELPATSQRSREITRTDKTFLAGSRGEYHFNNLTFDYKLMQLFPFPVEEKEWTITVDVFGDRTEHWLCAYGIVKFSRP